MQPIVSNGYSIFFDENLSSLNDFVANASYSKIFFVCDLHTSEHCLPLVVAALQEQLGAYDIIEVDPGEENKNIDFCIGIWQMLLDFGADRDSLIINVGGGVVTDMGGFAASTFKRGIAFVNVPTTLLAQVDASVGGKTGIDMGGVKNIIGTFTQPQAVFISPKFINTLPVPQVISGFAEVIKHGLIRDRDYFESLIGSDIVKPSEEVIYRSVQIKNEVVTADPYEKGLRKILNFGHTIGHAVETYSLVAGRKPLLHGEAIAIGMICEAFLSRQQNRLPAEELDRIITTLKRLFRPYDLPAAADEELILFMKNDKKNTGGKIGFALLKTIGECSFNHYCEEKDIVEALGHYRSLAWLSP